jgi:hypothetical protein
MEFGWADGHYDRLPALAGEHGDHWCRSFALQLGQSHEPA